MTYKFKYQEPENPKNKMYFVGNINPIPFVCQEIEKQLVLLKIKDKVDLGKSLFKDCITSSQEERILGDISINAEVFVSSNGTSSMNASDYVYGGAKWKDRKQKILCFDINKIMLKIKRKIK